MDGAGPPGDSVADPASAAGSPRGGRRAGRRKRKRAASVGAGAAAATHQRRGGASEGRSSCAPSAESDGGEFVVPFDVGGARVALRGGEVVALSRAQVAALPFFSGMLSGSFRVDRDERGALEVDRDPRTVRLLLAALQPRGALISRLQEALEVADEADYFAAPEAPLRIRLVTPDFASPLVAVADSSELRRLASALAAGVCRCIRPAPSPGSRALLLPHPAHGPRDERWSGLGVVGFWGGALLLWEHSCAASAQRVACGEGAAPHQPLGGPVQPRVSGGRVRLWNPAEAGETPQPEYLSVRDSGLRICSDPDAPPRDAPAAPHRAAPKHVFVPTMPSNGWFHREGHAADGAETKSHSPDRPWFLSCCGPLLALWRGGSSSSVGSATLWTRDHNGEAQCVHMHVQFAADVSAVGELAAIGHSSGATFSVYRLAPGGGAADPVCRNPSSFPAGSELSDHARSHFTMVRLLSTWGAGNESPLLATQCCTYTVIWRIPRRAQFLPGLLGYDSDGSPPVPLLLPRVAEWQDLPHGHCNSSAFAGKLDTLVLRVGVKEVPDGVDPRMHWAAVVKLLKKPKVNALSHCLRALGGADDTVVRANYAAVDDFGGVHLLDISGPESSYISSYARRGGEFVQTRRIFCKGALALVRAPASVSRSQVAAYVRDGTEDAPCAFLFAVDGQPAMR
eukprot:TRINITY_DN70055_c0_g1_i1.p1 TRINITY_DN70055_c0_g1~~TRINITY_DN70055_c0_g1_i1.p1  ORF type:complete len:702 (+),score=125.45 TRINITY_DN70055_c0_g1_i1:63-2108(+)